MGLSNCSSVKPDKQNVRICGYFKETLTLYQSSTDILYRKWRICLPSCLEADSTLNLIFDRRTSKYVPLDEESKNLLVLNTPKGLFHYTRLPYGVSSAPGIFQRLMENVLQAISNVIVYLDDILVTGANEKEHLKTLAIVLDCLEKAGIQVKKSKCQFMASSVSYLGHLIDKKGLHPLQKKVKAVKQAPSPTNVSELKAYLGLLTYYSKFLPNMANVLAPLYKLLRKDTRWKWSDDEENASKDLLTSDSLLVHFDSNLELVLMCDASSYGIGAVLTHRMPDSSERPIGYASRSLSKAQRNYFQLE